MNQRARGLYSGMILWVAACLFAAGAIADERAAAANDNVRPILDLVQQMQSHWNAGDIDAYLAAYEPAEATTVLFGNTVLKGWNSLAEAFKAAYPDPFRMGRYRVESTTVRFLTPELAVASGTFRHDFPDLIVNGAYTQVFRRTDEGGWRIVHEHTSRGHGSAAAGD